MSGVIAYWRERLVGHNPLRSEKLREPLFNIRLHRNQEGGWPRAVARQALVQDYVEWFKDVYLRSYDTPYYVENPDRKPQHANDLEFFSTMAPFLYVVGREIQTRGYLVKIRERYQGEWITVSRRRNFVRLCTWEEHVAAFQMQVGEQLPSLPVFQSQQETAQVVENAVRVVIRRTEANREAMNRSMGSPEST